MNANSSIANIGAKMDALGLWDSILPYNWAVKPSGTVLPYFCTVIKGDLNPVKVRLLMLEGWQTLHDYIRTRIDGNFGFYSSPMELPHLELVILDGGACELYRHDPGYMPVKAGEKDCKLAAKVLWQAYGVMLRLESERDLPLKFSEEKAVFARVESSSGEWSDVPLTIPDPPVLVEKVSLSKSQVAQAQDVVFAKNLIWEMDFRLMPLMMTKEKRARCVYQLSVRDNVSGENGYSLRLSVDPEGGLKALWESVPQRILKLMIDRAVVPGEIKLCSGRLFRFMRPLTMELPFKLSLHDSLPNLEELFR